MYAQVIEGEPAPERLGELARLIRSELLPALRAEPCFCGALSLVERRRGAAMLILLWETEGEAARPFAAASPELTELMGSSRASIWEVNARG